MIWNNIAIGLVGWGLVELIGWQALLLVEIPILIVAGACGIWLFYVQHQFENAYWERQEAWDADQAAIEGSSFYDLPRFLHWFTGNIGFHHIHHLASKVPNYRLRECYQSSPQLQSAPRLTLRESFRCARLKLWDEEQAPARRLPAQSRGLTSTSPSHPEPCLGLGEVRPGIPPHRAEIWQRPTEGRRVEPRISARAECGP